MFAMKISAFQPVTPTSFSVAEKKQEVVKSILMIRYQKKENTYN